jgi:hypothetical protein
VSAGKKTDEAFLLSRATSTAVVAARSILQSGGTEETALKTAKAAAQSVLNQNPGDLGEAETISRSTTFLRRRKAKRQAEVVASMALMSAMNNAQTPTAVSLDWENLATPSATGSVSGGGFKNTDTSIKYGQKIVTKSMDEPSVLSGSTKNNVFGGAHQREPSLASSDNNTLANRLAQIEARRQHLAAMNKQEHSAWREISASHQQARQNSPEKGHHRRLSSIDDRSYGSEDDSDEETFFTYVTDATSDNKDDDFMKSAVDPVVNGLTSVFNAFTCVPMNGFVAEPTTRSSRRQPAKRESRDKNVPKPQSSSAPQRKEAEQRESYDINNEDVLSERDEELHRFMRSLDGSEGSQEQREMTSTARKGQASNNRREAVETKHQPPPVMHQQSEDSSDSESDILRELNLSSSDEDDEEEIEVSVRSSIRETMENIVAQAKDSQDEADRAWLSYELRQESGPEILSSTNRKSRSKSIERKPKGWLRSKSPFVKRNRKAEI